VVLIRSVLRVHISNLVILNREKPINANITGRWFKDVVKGKRKYIRKKDEIKEKIFVGGTKIKDLRLYDMKHDPMTRERLYQTLQGKLSVKKIYVLLEIMPISN
jgi:hypothetical protein